VDLLQRMLELPAKERKDDTSSLRIIAASGSAIGAPLVRKVLKEFGPVLYNLYGSTEVSWVSIATPRNCRTIPTPRAALRWVPSWRCSTRTATRSTGASSAGCSSATECCSRATPASARTSGVVRGMMSTGDLGHLDDGLLYIDGRSDDMVVSGGENVYPGEVEDLINELDGVREVVVVGVDDEKFGARLAAYVVREPNSGGEPVDSDSIRAHVKAGLARFRVPRDVVFLDELPRNATGKVVARDLPSSTE